MKLSRRQVHVTGVHITSTSNVQSFEQIGDEKNENMHVSSVTKTHQADRPRIPDTRVKIPNSENPIIYDRIMAGETHQQVADENVHIGSTANTQSFEQIDNPLDMPDVRTTISKTEYPNIYDLIASEGWTQKRVAEYYKCSASTISRIYKKEKQRIERERKGVTQEKVGEFYGFSQPSVVHILPIFQRLEEVPHVEPFSNHDLVNLARVKDDRFRTSLVEKAAKGFMKSALIQEKATTSKKLVARATSSGTKKVWNVRRV